MEYAAWALYCYIAIQLINDRRKQIKAERQGSEPRGAHYYKIKGLIHTTIGLFGTMAVQLMYNVLSEYLPDTAVVHRAELMLVIDSKEINEQLGGAMQTYEHSARKANADGTYDNPYNVQPVALTPKRERRMKLIKNCLLYTSPSPRDS